MSTCVQHARTHLVSSLPDSSPSIQGLVLVGGVLLEYLFSMLTQPQQEQPRDDECFTICSWSAALLAPSALMLHRLPQLASQIDLSAQAGAIAVIARTLTQLLSQLTASKAAPFSRRIRSGAARPEVLARLLQSILEAGIDFHKRIGKQALAALCPSFPARRWPCIQAAMHAAALWVCSAARATAGWPWPLLTLLVAHCDVNRHCSGMRFGLRA